MQEALTLFREAQVDDGLVHLLIHRVEQALSSLELRLEPRRHRGADAVK